MGRNITVNTPTAAVRIETEERTDEDFLTPAQRLLLRHQKRRPSVEIVAATTSQPNNVRKELDEYLMMEAGDTQTQEILSWWVKHKKLFPILFQVVRMVLAIPASSSTSERCFPREQRFALPCEGTLLPRKSQMLC